MPVYLFMLEFKKKPLKLTCQLCVYTDKTENRILSQCITVSLFLQLPIIGINNLCTVIEVWGVRQEAIPSLFVVCVFYQSPKFVYFPPLWILKNQLFSIILSSF